MPKRKPINHLINIIESTQDHHPNFALFLGAGSSVSSGVKSASEMVSEWREKYFNIHRGLNDIEDDFFNKLSWYNTDKEYSVLFEELFDEPSQRREYIESCIVKAKPSWGYIYLINLIKEGVFNTIFTTNFDDLLNEACYLFSSEVRPIVCAHDSSIQSIRITSQRPKIIKLHGDFLFDNLKNTVRELETLERNMLDKFKQYASEYGFIVIGYGGNDRSIMDSFELLLKNEQNFPHGIYWCVKNGAEINDKVRMLSRFPKFRIIEIDGFDELFAEINESMKFELQLEMTDPYGALAKRLDNLTKNINLPEVGEINPIIRKHISQLGDKIKSSTNYRIKDNNLDQVDVHETINMPIPLNLLASISERNGAYDEAKQLILEQLNNNTSLENYEEAFRILFKAKDNLSIEKTLCKFLESSQLIISDPNKCLNISIVFIDYGDFDNANKILDRATEIAIKNKINYVKEYFFVNKLIIKVLQNIVLSAEDISIIESYMTSNDQSLVLAANILLKQWDMAESILENMKKKGKIVGMKTWPLIRLLFPHLKNSKIFS